MENSKDIDLLKRYVNLGLAGFLILLITIPLYSNSSGKTFVTTLMCYMALAQMWNLLAGYAGLVSFGQQLFVGMGGYSLAILAEKIGLNIWISVPLTGILAALIALPVGALTFRLRGGYFAVGTWVVAEIFRLAVGNWEYAGYAVGMYIKSARTLSEDIIYYVAILIGIGSVASITFLLKSKFGLNLLAIREDEEAAASLGVNVYWVKMRSFVISSAGIAMISCLIYIQTQFIQPNEAFSLNWSVVMSFMVIIGGLGTVMGPIVGALLYVSLQNYLSDLGPMAMIILGVITIITMIYWPKGLFGSLADKYALDIFRTRRILRTQTKQAPNISIPQIENLNHQDGAKRKDTREADPLIGPKMK